LPDYPAKIQNDASSGDIFLSALIRIFTKKKIMVQLGKYNTLVIKEIVKHGLYLDDGDGGQILLPSRYLNENMKPGIELEVFIYRDSEDRLVAVTDQPRAQAGELAFLQVVSSSAVGAFLDWGLPKDLLVPFSEQAERMITGKYYLVFVYVDSVTNRLLASSKLNRFIGNEEADLKPGTEQELIVARSSETGYHVIVDQRFWGILYHNEVFRKLAVGDRITGYVTLLRPDGKIDCSLYPPGMNRVEQLAGEIMEQLEMAGGFLPLSDTTDPEKIRELFNESKKTFKKALGYLFRQKSIVLTDEGFRKA